MSSTRLRTIQTFLDGYSSLSVDKMTERLSKDFTHHVLPASLDMPLRNRDEFAHHAGEIFSIFESFHMVPLTMFEDDKQNMVVINARMEGTLKNGAEWINECVMMVRLSRDGQQVVAIEEFVDSFKAMEMKKRHAPTLDAVRSSDMVGSGKEVLFRNVALST
ncbi:hypothetical protein B0T21DRAFT_357818 [Apiosordaria backusii]|uniref:SnoaL-like domain-containing protein n=1 Tax=Apiosordaria backusii TaxID=314023 RepID=A0AA40ES21_9PEZI|nr:hypothetical protein B0T21DRAFT_357818 [Apiosordaria backusii]